MKPLEIIFLILCIILAFAIPYWQKLKIYQFCFLLVFPFFIGYMLQTWILKGSSTGGMVLMAGFIAGFIYKAIKFYTTYVEGKSDGI